LKVEGSWWREEVVSRAGLVGLKYCSGVREEVAKSPGEILGFLLF